MNTVEIGREVTPTAVGAVHVVSTNLGLESRVERIGAEGPVFHARSGAVARRLVLVAGLDRRAGAAVLDSLDGLPDLPAREIVEAALRAAMRSALGRSVPTLPPSACALRIDRERAQWAASGDVMILVRRRASAWRAARVIDLYPRGPDEGHPVSSGYTRLAPGDEVLAWTGFGMLAERLSDMFGDAPARRGRQLWGTGLDGCLASLKRH